jgi:hypothetical protein
MRCLSATLYLEGQHTIPVATGALGSPDFDGRPSNVGMKNHELCGFLLFGLLLFTACDNPGAYSHHPRIRAYTQFQNTFGVSLARKAQHLQKQWSQAGNPKEMLATYHQLLALRDSIQLHFDFYQAKQQTSYMPELFWIKELVPGLVPELLENPRRYAFFIHYGWCLQQARQTKGDADDQFFQAQTRLFPPDGIEYLHPNYRIETDAGRTHSLLGRGLHLAHLRNWDSLLTKYPGFEKEYFLLKNRCIEDIFSPKATFWEEKTRIQQELQEILSTNLAILNKADNIALQTRLVQLKEPQKYGLSVDWQSGRAD